MAARGAWGGIEPLDLPSEGFFIPAATQQLLESIDLSAIGASMAALQQRTGGNVSILGDILRAPASSPGTSTSLGGDLVQFGAELFGGWVQSKTRAKAQKAAAKAARTAGMAALQLDPRITYQGGSNVSILGSGVAPAQVPPSYSDAPYVEAGYSNAAYYPTATYASAPAVIAGAAGAVRALAATPMIRAAIAWLQQNGLSAAAAATAVAGLVQGGFGGTDGPYANPKHNKCTGIMRGDVMAVRRVKRQGKRLMKVLRQAGVGGRRSAGRFRSRRRAC